MDKFDLDLISKVTEVKLEVKLAVFEVFMLCGWGKPPIIP
jgi:hypothetical protein